MYRKCLVFSRKCLTLWYHLLHVASLVDPWMDDQMFTARGVKYTEANLLVECHLSQWNKELFKNGQKKLNGNVFIATQDLCFGDDLAKPRRKVKSRGSSVVMPINIRWLDRQRAQRGCRDQRSVAARSATFPQAAGTHTSSGLASISPREAVRARMYSLEWVAPWQPLPRRHLRIAKNVFAPYTHVTRKPKTWKQAGEKKQNVL